MTSLVRRSEDAVSVGAEEVLDPVDLSVVAAVRLVELDAAPVAVAEVGATVVPQDAAFDARDLKRFRLQYQVPMSQIKMF